MTDTPEEVEIITELLDLARKGTVSVNHPFSAGGGADIYMDADVANLTSKVCER